MADVILPQNVAQQSPTVSILPKFKLSELPLTKEQRTTTDILLNTFKKKGGYDKLRKQVWAEYNGSDARNAFTKAITDVAEEAIENDSDLLGKERGKAATLIQGSVDRSGAYKAVESEIDKLVASHLDVVLESVRDIRRHDVGEEKAAEEAQVGSKTDEEYAGMRVARKAEREALSARLAKDQETIDKLKARISEKEEAKRRRKEEDDRKAREAEEEQRRIERHKRREQQRREEEAREKERDERYRKRREEEREKFYPHRLDERRHDSRASTPKPELDEKAIEAAALERLINEGKALAERNKQRPDFDFEKAEAMEVNTRRAYAARRDYDRERPRHYRDRSGSRDRHRPHHDHGRYERSRSRERPHHARHENSRHEQERPSKEGIENRKIHDAGSIPTHHDDKHYRARSKSPGREREPDRRRSHRDDPREDGRSRRQRSATPPFNIDRYVPGGGVHRDPTIRDKEKRREYDREGRRDRSRDREKEVYRESRRYEYDRPREERRHDYGEPERRERTDRDRDREHRHRDRERDRRSRSPRRREERRDERRDDRRARDDENYDDRRERRKTFVEIDRYVPGGR